MTADPATQLNNFANAYRHPDKLQFDPLRISFELDEDMINYEEIYKWFVSMAPPQNFRQYGKNSGHFLYHDIILQMHTNTNNPNFRIKYMNAFPISLSAPNLDQTVTPDVILVSDATFRYDYFVFDRPST